MAKKPKPRHAPLNTPAQLQARIERAVQEDRYQQALELSKQLYKQEPTPAHKELLQRSSLGRARQLRTQGYGRDAAAILENLLQQGVEDAAFLEQLAGEMAASGAARQALALAERLADPQVKVRLLGQAADAAMQQGPVGRGQLPPDLQGPFDLIVQTFRHLEAGQDDQAREALQGIGLQSPFLEWKLLLRGLQAYYHNDDARALENWQRLNTDRLPARLAAPLRYAIDPPFRLTQPPETQAVLKKQADRLQDSGLLRPLRDLQAALADAEQLPRSFRLAEQILPALRQQAPHLAPRLAVCFHWAVISSGEPEDVPRYQRVFGAPAEDPKLARFRALLHEHLYELQEAHKHWQEFEKSVASLPDVWPGEQADRVRALVWAHMGQNAASVPDVSKIPDLPPFLRDHPDRPRPLKPSAEKCFERSLELAPDQLDTCVALLRYHQQEKNDAKAAKVAHRLLERFPDHVPTLETLAGLCGKQGRHAEALALWQRALQANPLDRRLRDNVSTAHLFHARDLAEMGRFDDARAGYQAALALSQAKNNATIYCKWAACEFKAGDAARGEELLEKALAEAGNRLAVAFSMVIEIIRLKLPRSLKTRFDKELNESLAGAPTGTAAAHIADTAASHLLAGVTYHGQKTHEKKVLTYLDKALEATFTEAELEAVGNALKALESRKLLQAYSAKGQREFPDNPVFYLREAEGYIAMGPYRCQHWRMQPLLQKAEELTLKLPPDERRKLLLESIEGYKQMTGLSDMLSGLFGGDPESRGTALDMLDAMYGEDEEDEDEEAGDDY